MIRPPDAKRVGYPRYVGQSDSERLASALSQAREEGALTLARHSFREPPGELGAMARLRSLHLVALPELERATGVERLVGLESIALTGIAPGALPDLFDRLAQLPGLAKLAIDAETAAQLPPELDRLQGLLELELRGAARADLGALFQRLGRLEGLRIVRLLGDRSDGVVTLPPATAALVRLRVLTLGAPCPVLAEVVTSLPALETLTVASPILKRHRIKAIPATIGRLTALRALHLRGHALAAVPESLCDLVELRSLDLFGSPFRTLPARFGALVNLVDLDLSYCRNLEALPDGIGEIVALRTLLARDTAITRLPASFAKLRLTTVELPADLADGLTLAPPETTYVDELTVDRPYDHALPDDLGDPVRLEIRVPRLAEPAVAFDALRRLESLSVAAAPAFDLEDALRRLATAPHLARLYLTGWEHLAALPSTIGGLVHLETLSLAGGALSTLPDEIGALGALTSLDLSDNPVRTLPEACRRLAALEHLRLADVDPLPEGLRHLPSLKRLTLSNLTGAALPAELGALVQLETLELHGCATTDLGVLGELASLRRLELTWHRGAFDPAALFRALRRTRIEVLSFRDARALRELPAELGELTTLESIDVCSTDVRAFPPETARLGALRRVQFQDFCVESAALKKVLPKGRWRKLGAGYHGCTYQRAD